MKKCINCGKELDDNATVCVNCGHVFDRNANVGEIIVAILFPIVGCILYYVYKNDKPTAAQTLNKVSICTILGYFVLYFMKGFLLAILLTM